MPWPCSSVCLSWPNACRSALTCMGGRAVRGCVLEREHVFAHDCAHPCAWWCAHICVSTCMGICVPANVLAWPASGCRGGGGRGEGSVRRGGQEG
eukprot:10798577-Alexandrium_andersonii.AAC.1